MRPLRDTYASTRVPKDPHPSEPVALLSSVARPEPTHDPSTHADRAFLGMEVDEVRALGERAVVLTEVAWELLEQASVWFDRLSGLRIGVVHAGPSGIEVSAVPRALGLVGPVVSTTDEPALFSAIHLGAQMIRAHEADLVLALAETGGGAGVCLGRAEKAAQEDWVVAGLLSGIAASRGAAGATATLAATRAGFPHLPVSGGAAELSAVLHEIGHGTASVLLLETAGDRSVALVVAPAEPQSISDRSPRFLGLSARSDRSLRSLAGATAEAMQDGTDVLAFAMDAARRPPFEHRVALPVGPLSTVRDRLGDFAAGQGRRVPAGTVVDGEPTGVVFVVPPSGAQLARAADRLYEVEPAFRDALNRCDRIARPHLPRALLSVLFPSPGREAELDDPGYANPATVALAWSLAELLRSFGIEPCAVIGCGVGEVVAAAISGAVELEQALRLSIERGKLVRTIEDVGRRAVVGASEEQVTQMLLGERDLDLVAVPRPGRVVVGGTEAAVARFVERIRLRGIRAAEVPGNPVHTPLVDPILAEYRAAAEVVESRASDVPLVSTVTGRLAGALTAEHWVGTLRAPLRFADAVHTAHQIGGRNFVELAPRATMSSAGETTLRDRGVRFLPALAPGADDREHVAEVLSNLWVRGVAVRLDATARVPSSRVLPTYPFDRRPLDEPWEDEPTRDERIAPASWLQDLPEEEAEITLVPSEEARVDELLDLERQTGPEPLRPMFLPPADADDGMSVDSDPVADITLDDLRYQGPGRGNRSPVPPLEAPAASDQDLLGHQGPCWAEQWDDAPIPEVLLEGTTFVVLTEGGLGDTICALAEESGHRVIRVERGPEVPRSSPTVFVPDPLAEDAWIEVMEAVGTLLGTVQVVHLWSAADEEVDEVAGWPSVVSLVQELVAEGLPAAVHLVTSGVLAAHDDVRRDAGASLWGAAGLVSAETGLLAGIVDVDPADPDPAALYAHVLAQAVEGETAGWFSLSGATRRVRRLVARPEPPRPEGVDVSGTWVLGGDVDGLMLDLASWLVGRGVKRLFMVGASAPPAEVLKAALDLQKRGTACIVVRADATDPKGAETIRQRLSREKQLSGVILRFQPTPCAFRELDPAALLPAWRLGLRTAEVLADIASAGTPMYAWSEARALDGAPGNGVGACLATALAARLTRRAAAGSPSSVVHTGPHTTLPPGESVRLVTGLCALGGQWGVWLP